MDPSRIVTQVNLTMHGRFRCPSMSQHGQHNLPPTILNILVESAAVTQEPLDYPACLECAFCNTCDSCMTSVKVTGTQFETWPTAWNYYTNVRCRHHGPALVLMAINSCTRVSCSTTTEHDQRAGAVRPGLPLRHRNLCGDGSRAPACDDDHHHMYARYRPPRPL